MTSNPAAAGYYASPWPAEDGGPQRLQLWRGLNLQPGARLRAASRRTMLSTMTVLGAPGEVYLLTHQALRSNLGLPTRARVERIDPLTLQPLQRSPWLAGGPMWPGGLAVHRNGELVVVYGRHAHRLDRQCQPRATLQLPLEEPYNSFVVLDNGLIVTKNLSQHTPARLTVIEPEAFTKAAPDIDVPEPSVARLSAVGNTVYVVGLRTLWRYRWDDSLQRLVQDPHWRHDYITEPNQGHGWDAVLTAHDAWLMDNGRHRYRWRMQGTGVDAGHVRLIRVSLHDAADHQALPVSGLRCGAITNPPLVDAQRGIVLGYDSAHAVLQAWQYDATRHELQPLWRKAPFGCASHLLLDAARGQVVINDHRNDLRRRGEEVVLLDITTGAELGRVRTGGLMQGVVFPSPGWNEDLYWCSMDRISRIHAA